MAAAASISLLLAGIFLASGLSKIGRLNSTREMLERFRLPRPLLSNAAAVALPVVEIGVGLGLLFAPAPVFVAVAIVALGLTLSFVSVTVRALQAGEQFDCGCFGSHARTPISGLLVGRNAVLALLAAAVVSSAIGQFPGTIAALGEFSGADWIWLAALIGTAAVSALFVGASSAGSPRASTEVRQDQPVDDAGGRVIPDIEVVTAQGEVLLLAEMVAMEPVLLLFVRHGCGSCEQAIARFARSSHTDLNAPRVVVAADAAPHVFLAGHPELADDAVFAVKHAREYFGVEHTPSAVLIGLNGRWLSGPVSGESYIADLLTDAPALVSAPY